MTTFEQVLPLADTVLYEGYVLYPYRADDSKNRVRWQFGVLAPPALADSDASEHSRLQADLLLEGGAETVELKVRFLQVQHRSVQRAVGNAWEDLSRLDAGDTAYLPFDEAVSRDLDVRARLSSLVGSERVEVLSVAGGVDVELVPGGRLHRERMPLEARVTLRAEELPGPYGVTRLSVIVQNTTAWMPTRPPRRDEALRHSLVAAHLLVRLEPGRFLSLTDPPEWAGGYVAGCTNEGVWPVLAGDGGKANLVLCSPIILPDNPQLAPESTTEFFDATEMDEMLSLRALTLTDDEKRAVRGTDPRAAELLDRVETLSPELMDRLHGAVRYLAKKPSRVEKGKDAGDVAVDVVVNGVPVHEGTKVLLRPGARRSDAQDLFLAGRTATVTKVLHDLDGKDHVAVLLDDDPGQDMARIHGRFLYFAPDEIEPLAVRS